MEQKRVQLKSIKFSESLSEETNAFTANIYFDGKKIGYCKNSGQGGETEVHSFPESREKFIECEKFCKTLPPITYGKDLTLPSNVYHIVDELFEEWLEIKSKKKLLKDCENGVCYGSSNLYRIVKWSGYNIKTLLEHPQGKQTLKKTIKEIKDQGNTILNTNLPIEVMG
jgi:hypothetical protein